MDKIKSGWKTSEFWLSLLAVLVGAVVSSGLLPDAGPWVKGAGIISAMLGTLGYSVSRGLVKSAASTIVPGLLLVSAGLLAASLLSGCAATWQQTAKVSLDSAGEVTVGARQVGEPRWIAACNADARACAAAKTPDCPALVACQAKHHKFNAALKAVHTARFLGYSAILAANRAAADGALAAIRPAVAAITDVLAALKVIP